MLVLSQGPLAPDHAHRLTGARRGVWPLIS